MTEWKECAAEEYCNKVSDGTHDTPKPIELGEYLITSKHITGGKVDLSSAYRISKDDFEKISIRSRVDKWDVLVSMIGTVGEVVLVDHEPNYAIKNIGLFKCGDEVKARWLKYYLQSPVGREEMRSRMCGTTQEYISLGELRKLPIKFPPLPEQRAIAGVLSSLDDKIDLLHRQNKTLESLAETLWRKMLVEDADPKWEKGKLKDICLRITKGTTPTTLKRPFTDAGINFVKAESLDNYGFFIRSKFAHIDEETNKILCRSIVFEHDILYTIAGTIGRTAVVTKEILPANTNQAVAIIRLKNSKMFLSFVRLLLKTNAMSDDLNSKIVHAVQPNLSLGEIAATDILIPPESVLLMFNSKADVLFNKIKYNSIQIQSLSDLRDSLLPKIMSGEATIS